VGLRGPLALIALLAAVTAGCGSDVETTPAPTAIAGPPQRAARVVQGFEVAVRDRDFARVCDELFSPDARRREGGDRCAARLAAASAGLRQPRIRPLAIKIAGARAEVRVRSRAQGQAPVESTIELDLIGGRYRISALGR
jgi:hypothetical protein